MNTAPITLLPLLALAALTLGCGDNVDDVELPLPDTEVLVDPTAFLGALPCGNNAGSFHDFVVTLWKHTDEHGNGAEQVATSLRVPCSIRARFRGGKLAGSGDAIVVAGAWYSAEVTGYDAPSDGHQPTPRWNSRCGYNRDGSPAPVKAIANRRTPIQPCLPLDDTGTSPTRVSLSPAAVWGPDGCPPGASYDVTSDSDELPPVAAVGCGDAPSVFDVTAEHRYSVYVRTSDGSRGAVCEAYATAHITQPMACTPLNDSGSARVSLSQLVDAQGQPLCPVDGSFQLSLDDAPLHSAPLNCDEAPLVGPLLAGAYSIDVQLFTTTHAAAGAATCIAQVLPGKNTAAACTAVGP